MKKLKDDFLFMMYVKIVGVVGLLYALMNLAVYGIDRNAGIIVSLFFLAYVLGVIFILYKKTPRFSNEIVKYAANYDKIQNRLLKDLIIPYAIIDMNGSTLWANEAFLNVVGKFDAKTTALPFLLFKTFTLEFLAYFKLNTLINIIITIMSS